MNALTYASGGLLRLSGISLASWGLLAAVPIIAVHVSGSVADPPRLALSGPADTSARLGVSDASHMVLGGE